MKIKLIAVGEKMPSWVQQGFGEFAKRLSGDCRLQLVEVPAGRRGKGANHDRATRDEGQRMLRAIPKGAHIVALEQTGCPWSTRQLADQLKGWLAQGRDSALLIGGPEGLAPDCLAAAGQQWSLSPLTLPHPLVRVIVAEQLYRAWSILHNHPYHRG